MSTKLKAIAALKWATAAKLIVQLISWAGTLVVVRLLSPADYGLMAKVSVVCGIAGVIAELGLTAAIVRAAEVNRDDLRKLYGISLIFGTVITLAVAAASPLLAGLFREPRLTWPIAATSLNIVIGSIAVVPSAMWTRELAFRRLAMNEIMAGLVTIVATVLIALMSGGVWSLVLGTLLGSFTRSCALLILGDRVWPIFSTRGIAEHVKFGLTMVSSRVSYFAVVQSDVIVGSAFLSTIEIGQYAVALQLATLPMAKMMGTINQITLPMMARQQNDRVWVRQAMLRSIGLLSLLSFPMLWGISAVAPELVRVLFGERWLAVVPALVILPLIVPVRMVCTLIFTTSLALGNRRLDLRNTIANSILLPAGFFIGAHWGLIGLCTAWLVSVPLSYSFSLGNLLGVTGIRMWDLGLECGAPALAAALMYAAVAALRLVLGGLPAFVNLMILSAAGALVYFGVLTLISRRHLSELLSFGRALLAKKVPDPASPVSPAPPAAL
jgi:teichuronic acid exporter